MLHRLLSPELEGQANLFRGRPLLKSLCRLASLLWLHSLHADCSDIPSAVELRFDQLHHRLSAHGLPYQGNAVMLWHVLLKKEESIEIDDRAWPVVRMTSVAKRMGKDLVDDLADLLWGQLANQGMQDEAVAHGLIAKVRKAITC